MTNLKLAIATTDYDHFRDFQLGLVRAEGIDHTWLTLDHHEIFARFTFNREWEAGELSFAKAVAQLTRENSDIVGLPVVCSRLFRFSSFYVNKKSKIKTAADLKSKTIGSPEWAHTAAVYMRGWLNDEHGVGLKNVHWYQAGANEAGRIEKVELNIPAGVTLTHCLSESLSSSRKANGAPLS
jgi:4,5-dihydroxyphthalate decarboxylase